MTVGIQATVSLNGGSITATAYEDIDQDGTAEASESVALEDGTNEYHLDTLSGGTGNDYWLDFSISGAGDESTPRVDSASLITERVAKLTTSVSLNGGSITATVYEDTDGDGTAEQTESLDLSAGNTTHGLFFIDVDSGNDYWLDFTISGAGDESTPTVDSATLQPLVEFINAQAATITATGPNAGLDAGGASITAQEATLSTAAQNAGLDPGAASITAAVASLDATGQNPSVSPGVAQIQADAGVLQITAESASRVFDSTTLSGTVTLNGSAVEGATIYCIDDTNESIAEVTTTDSNGDYRVRVDTGDTYHMVVQYEDGQGNQYNDESKPFLAT